MSGGLRVLQVLERTIESLLDLTVVLYRLVRKRLEPIEDWVDINLRWPEA